MPLGGTPSSAQGLLLFLWGGMAYPAVLRIFSWFCAQVSFLVGLGEPQEMPGVRSRSEGVQGKHPTCRTRSGPKVAIFIITTFSPFKRAFLKFLFFKFAPSKWLPHFVTFVFKCRWKYPFRSRVGKPRYEKQEQTFISPSGRKKKKTGTPTRVTSAN